MKTTAPPTPSTFLPRALLLAAIFVLAMSIENDFQYRFLNSDQQSYVDMTLGIDQVLRPFTERGNTFLYFGHPTADRSTLARRWYFRSVYDAYPNRVWVADPSIVINDDRDIIHNNFNPEDAWLADHGISALLSFDPDLSRFNAHNVPARSR